MISRIVYKYPVMLTYFCMIMFSYIMTGTVTASDQLHSIASDNNTNTTPVNLPKDSVLHLIPQTNVGLIYCPSLRELNGGINDIVSQLIPQAGNTDLLVKMLANTVGTGFQSLVDLEKVGIDIDKDFALFFTNLVPIQVSAAMHLTDPEAMKQVLFTEAEGSTPIEYNGITYWSSAEGSGTFALLDNILVYSQQIEVCKNLIDIHKGTDQGISLNSDYSMFITDILNGIDQLGVYFHIETFTGKFDGSFEKGLNSITNNLADVNDPLSIGTLTLIIKSLGQYSKLIEQFKHMSFTVHLHDLDIHIKKQFKFKNESEFLKGFKRVSSDLNDIHILPNRTILNAGFQGSSSLLVELSTIWFQMIQQNTIEEDQHNTAWIQEIRKFYESLADVWYFSLNFEKSIIPDYMFIYELKDEQYAKNYMDKVLLEKLQNYYQVYAGKPFMYNGFEIRNFIFTNFKMNGYDDIPEESELMPSEWQWYFAFSDGKLFWTMGTSDEYIKRALDRHSGMVDEFSENTSFQKLVDNLGTDDNVFVTVSPIVAIKNFLPLLSQVDPNSAAPLQMFSVLFNHLPENYSIGLSAKVVEDRIDAKLLITIGDFQQLFQMFAMMFGEQ